MKRRQFLDYSVKSLVLTGTGLKTVNHLVKADVSKTGLVLDESFKYHHIAPRHPESPERYIAIRQLLTELDLISRTVGITPITDIEPWLRLIHTEFHINAIKEADPQLHNNVSRATGGVIAAVDQVCSGKLKNAFCATRPPGHHARNTGKEEGFCYYNHIAIAARYAQQKYGLKKILIVDWDYHHGNGTEEFFYSDPDILFFSTHDYYAYPGTGHPDKKGQGAGLGFNINVHLDCGAGDDDFFEVFKYRLIPTADNFQPDLILVSSGFDSRVDDLLGCHKVTDQGYMELTGMVMRLADRHCQGRVVSILEGGYNISGNARAAAAHLEALMG